MKTLTAAFLFGVAGVLGIGQATAPDRPPSSVVPRTGPAPGPPHALNFPRKPTDEALNNYAQLTGRTILRDPFLPASLPASIKGRLREDTNAAIAFIEGELHSHGIEIIPHSEAFALAVPSSWSNSPFAAQVASVQQLPNPALLREATGQPADTQPVQARDTRVSELFQAGTVDFRGVDLEQFLQFYGALLERTILRPAQFAYTPITFRTQQPLTRAQLLYGLETTLALNGIAAVHDGDKFVLVFPVQQAAMIQPRAPRPEPRAALIDPGKVPVFQSSNRISIPRLAPKPPTWREQLAQFYLKVRTKLGYPPPTPPSPTVNRLLAFYGKLADRKPLPSGQIGQQLISFEVKTPLTKAELLYAIEATLALQGVRIEPVDAKSIRAERLSPGTKSQTGSKITGQ